MGYRSEVIFGVKSEYKDEINAIIKEHDLEESFAWYERDCFFGNLKEDWVVYRGEYLKWYDEYRDVSAINSAIDKIINDSPLDDYAEAFMVCLGEDNELHNERGHWYDFAYRESRIQLFK